MDTRIRGVSDSMGWLLRSEQFVWYLLYYWNLGILIGVREVGALEGKGGIEELRGSW